MQGFTRPTGARPQPASLHSQPAEPARRASVAAERVASSVYTGIFSCLQQRDSTAPAASAAYGNRQQHGRPCHFQGASHGCGYHYHEPWMTASIPAHAWAICMHNSMTVLVLPCMQLAPRFQQGRSAGTASMQHANSLRQPSVSPWHFASQGRRQPQRGVRRLLPVNDGLPSTTHLVCQTALITLGACTCSQSATNARRQ
jgi:hypothetical protein